MNIVERLPKYRNVRVCYEGGNSVTGEKIYELKKYCKCSSCDYKLKHTRYPSNCITVTTKDTSKIDEIADFLKNWTCEDNGGQERVYLKF